MTTIILPLVAVILALWFCCGLYGIYKALACIFGLILTFSLIHYGVVFDVSSCLLIGIILKVARSFSKREPTFDSERELRKWLKSMA